MQFSQKIGKTPIDTVLQVDSASESLRSALWNVLYRTILDDSFALGGPSYHEEMLDDLWEFFYKLPVDERPKPKHALVQLKHWVMNTDWYRLYDLLEFVVGSIQPSRISAFEASCNKVLERERSAFRLMRGTIIPITDMIEFKTVMEASDLLEEYGLEACRSHLATAVGELSRRSGVADYDLAILEAARSVRAIFRDLSGKQEADTNEALSQLDSCAPIPPGLRSALEGLFTVGDSTEDRHLFRKDETTPGLAEARLMVVMASATINYLLAFAGPPPETAQKATPKRLTGRSTPRLEDGEQE